MSQKTNNSDSISICSEEAIKCVKAYRRFLEAYPKVLHRLEEQGEQDG